MSLLAGTGASASEQSERLYSRGLHISSHLSAYATLKATGYTNTYLFKLVFREFAASLGIIRESWWRMSQRLFGARTITA